MCNMGVGRSVSLWIRVRVRIEYGLGYGLGYDTRFMLGHDLRYRI